MSRAAMIVLVSLLAYSLLGVAISIVTAIVWRTRAVAPANLPPITRARRLLQLRLMPSVAAAAITLFVITPAFAMFEPDSRGERAGPILLTVCALSSILIVLSIARAARSLWMTRRLERQWLHASEVIDASRAAGLPAFAIASPSPMVALVGVFEPKLIAARTVVDACTPDEIACIVAHERGHFDARDNLKRWVMASLPDLLRWTPIHKEIVDAWHHAAEDAADDAATGGHAVARAELAALLLKIVRLAPSPAWDAAIVSPFVEHHGLERRVRRLLQPEIEPPAPLAIMPTVAVAAMAVAMVTAMSSLAILEKIFHALENLVAFGR
ncbi:MAG TPA: M56 family metallopeptidase [Vicinamibacterales bacterium]|nr:M56 family metallopeptidase [Vicinamibacterales bacterium]